MINFNNDYTKDYTPEEDGFYGEIHAIEYDSNIINIENWLNLQKVPNAKKIKKVLEKNVNKVLILKSINVEEEYQGKGYGSEMFEEMLNETYPEAIILLCDNENKQKNGFILEKFYEGYDFKRVNSLNSPLMVYPEELADKILNELKRKKRPKI